MTADDASAPQNALWRHAACGDQNAVVTALPDAQLPVMAVAHNPLGLTAVHLAALGGQVYGLTTSSLPSALKGEP